jgi:hypothetical protein
MLKRIKDRGKKVKEKVLSINQSASPNPQSANISTSAGLQGSNDLTLIPQTDQASGTATPTVPDHSKPRLAKPDKTSLTRVDEQQQLAEATVRVFFLFKIGTKLTITSNQSQFTQATFSTPIPRNVPQSEPTVWTFFDVVQIKPDTRPRSLV